MFSSVFLAFSSRLFISVLMNCACRTSDMVMTLILCLKYAIAKVMLHFLPGPRWICRCESKWKLQSSNYTDQLEKRSETYITYLCLPRNRTLAFTCYAATEMLSSVRWRCFLECIRGLSDLDIIVPFVLNNWFFCQKNRLLLIWRRPRQWLKSTGLLPCSLRAQELSVEFQVERWKRYDWSRQRL